MEALGVRGDLVREREWHALVCGGGNEVQVAESGKCEEYDGA